MSALMLKVLACTKERLLVTYCLVKVRQNQGRSTAGKCVQEFFPEACSRRKHKTLATFFN